MMKEIVAKYKRWEEERPDPGRQYDDIPDFVDGLSRGELLLIFATFKKMYKGLVE